MNEFSDKASVSWLVVDARNNDQRIDNYLFRLLKGVPKSHIYRILRTGEVRVNKGRIRANYRLKLGDTIRIPPIQNTFKEGVQVSLPQKLKQQVRASVLHEDENLLIVNKPSGLAVHAGSGIPFGIIDIAREIWPKSALELAHRLDKETSGCLILAKNRQTLLAVQQLLQESKIEKKYLALVYGRVAEPTFTVDRPLRRFTLSGGERRVSVDADGKKARTHFKMIDFFPRCTLLEAYPATGRTHQIRVHAASTGHPIAGDEKYGIPVFNQYMKENDLHRLFLHAHYLSFVLPNHGNEICVSAPLDAQLAAVLSRVEREP